MADEMDAMLARACARSSTRCRSGKLVSSRRITLNRIGNATVRVSFGRRRVGRVELVLMNASDCYICWQGSPCSTKAPRARRPPHLPFPRARIPVRGLLTS